MYTVKFILFFVLIATAVSTAPLKQDKTDFWKVGLVWAKNATTQTTGVY